MERTVTILKHSLHLPTNKRYCFAPRSPCFQCRASQQTLLGIPDTLKFHRGWKKWKLAVSDSIHTFQSKDQALDAAAWFQVTECHLQQKQFKTLADEVKTVGQKAPRNKKDAVAAVLRIRYKKDPMGCICCVHLLCISQGQGKNVWCLETS